MNVSEELIAQMILLRVHTDSWKSCRSLRLETPADSVQYALDDLWAIRGHAD